MTNSQIERAQKYLEPDSYFDILIKTLKGLVEQLEEDYKKDRFTLAKAVFLAEFLNEQLDKYLGEFFAKGDSSLREWFKTEDFKAKWKELKRERDDLYSSFIKVQREIGKEEVNRILTQYCSMITRYAFPDCGSIQVPRPL